MTNLSWFHSPLLIWLSSYNSNYTPHFLFNFTWFSNLIWLQLQILDSTFLIWLIFSVPIWLAISISIQCIISDAIWFSYLTQSIPHCTHLSHILWFHSSIIIQFDSVFINKLGSEFPIQVDSVSYLISPQLQTFDSTFLIRLKLSA